MCDQEDDRQSAKPLAWHFQWWMNFMKHVWSRRRQTVSKTIGLTLPMVGELYETCVIKKTTDSQQNHWPDTSNGGWTLWNMCDQEDDRQSAKPLAWHFQWWMNFMNHVWSRRRQTVSKTIGLTLPMVGELYETCVIKKTTDSQQNHWPDTSNGGWTLWNMCDQEDDRQSAKPLAWHFQWWVNFMKHVWSRRRQTVSKTIGLTLPMVGELYETCVIKKTTDSQQNHWPDTSNGGWTLWNMCDQEDDRQSAKPLAWHFQWWVNFMNHVWSRRRQTVSKTIGLTLPMVGELYESCVIKKTTDSQQNHWPDTSNGGWTLWNMCDQEDDRQSAKPLAWHFQWWVNFMKHVWSRRRQTVSKTIGLTLPMVGELYETCVIKKTTDSQQNHWPDTSNGGWTLWIMCDQEDDRQSAKPLAWHFQWWVNFMNHVWSRRRQTVSKTIGLTLPMVDELYETCVIKKTTDSQQNHWPDTSNGGWTLWNMCDQEDDRQSAKPLAWHFQWWVNFMNHVWSRRRQTVSKTIGLTLPMVGELYESCVIKKTTDSQQNHWPDTSNGGWTLWIMCDQEDDRQSAKPLAWHFQWWMNFMNHVWSRRRQTVSKTIGLTLPMVGELYESCVIKKTTDSQQNHWPDTSNGGWTLWIMCVKKTTDSQQNHWPDTSNGGWTLWNMCDQEDDRQSAKPLAWHFQWWMNFMNHVWSRRRQTVSKTIVFQWWMNFMNHVWSRRRQTVSKTIGLTLPMLGELYESCVIKKTTGSLKTLLIHGTNFILLQNLSERAHKNRYCNTFLPTSINAILEGKWLGRRGKRMGNWGTIKGYCIVL